MVDLFVILWGLIWGSFANVLIHRWPRGQSWLVNRSVCPACQQQLRLVDLVPVLSFVYLRGRCRYCRQAISWQYPVVELLTAGMTYLAWWAASHGWQLSGVGQLGLFGLPLIRLGLLWLVGFTGIVTAVIDLKHYLIPDWSNWLIGLSGTMLGLINHDWQIRLVAGLLASGFMASIYFLTKGKGMGWGDVKLSLALGLWLGGVTQVGMMAAYVLGAAMGLILLALRQAQLKQAIPFGPFLLLGAGLAMMFGQSWWQWYWGLITI